jgi:hypothetical protein
MLARATLEVLAEAAEIGLPEAATVPASAFDPFLRPAITKRVRRAVVEALSRVREGSPGDHVLRVAFLFTAGAPSGLDANDQSAVIKAFETLAAPYLPKQPQKPVVPGGAYRAAAADRDPDTLRIPVKRPKRFWPIATPLAVCVLLGVLGGLGIFLAPLLIPSPIARFRSTQLGAALDEPLTRFVVEGDAAMLTPALRKELGDKAHDALTRVTKAVPAAKEGESIEAGAAPLFAAVNDLNRELSDARVPALLHAYVQGAARSRSVWLTSYFVSRRDAVTFGGAPVKVAWGHRLDGLNLTDSLLYKADAEDWAILSLDRVEKDFVQSLLVPIVQGSAMGPTSYESSDRSPMAELARAAAPLIVKELLDASKIDVKDAELLHRAIVQRNELVVSLSNIGYGLKPSSALELSPHTLRRMERAKAENPKDKNLLEDYVKLGQRTAGYRKSVVLAVALFAQFEQERFVARFSELERLAKADVKNLGRAGAYPRGRASASADLALLVRPSRVPRLALWRLGERVLGDDEDEGTVAILSALLRELGLLDAADPTLAVDRVFIRAFQKAMELPTEQVRTAAGKAYAGVFGGPPPALSQKALP